METVEVFGDLDMRAVGDRLCLARRQRGLSQQSLCVLAGLEPTHYSGIEKGKKKGLRVATLYKLCMVLDVGADYLLGLHSALALRGEGG